MHVKVNEGGDFICTPSTWIVGNKETTSVVAALVAYLVHTACKESISLQL